MSDIKERLQNGSLIYGEEYIDRNGYKCRDIINEEILAEIELLEAQNKRYRDALQNIADKSLKCENKDHEFTRGFLAAIEVDAMIAQAALKDNQQKGE